MFGNMYCRNPKRLAATLRRGDTVYALAFTGVNSGFSGNLEVRAVDWWGVYAVIRDPNNQALRSYNTEWRNKILKCQFRIKWKHISSVELK